MRDDIIKSANEVFKLNTIYNRNSIEESFKKNNTSFVNITAYTYNRWNKGMNEIIEIFEYLGRDTYKYIGTKEISKYSGPVFHNPLGGKHEYKIGDWFNGTFNFLDQTLKTFSDWKNSEYEGISIIVVDSKVCFETLDEKIKQYKIITTDITKTGKTEGKYTFIDISSNLGKILLHKCLDDTFEFGTNKFKITEITY